MNDAVLVLAAATTLMAQNNAVSGGTCAIQGSVVFEENGTPIPFTNVVVLDTHDGAATNQDGLFEIYDLRPGAYTVRAFAIGYRSQDRGVTVVNGVTARIDFALRHSGMSAERAAAESVGVDVSAVSSDFELHLAPAFDELRVGDRPEFEITLQNNSRESVRVADLIGQENWVRCPIQKLEVTGPMGELGRARVDCGRSGGPNLIRLEPGDSVVGHLRCRGRCLKPGVYRAKFRYSSTSSDVRDWVRLTDQGIGPRVSKALRRAAMIDLSDSLEFVVKE